MVVATPYSSLPTGKEDFMNVLHLTDGIGIVLMLASLNIS